MSPTEKLTSKDTNAYLLLMKKPIQETTTITYVIAALKMEL